MFWNNRQERGQLLWCLLGQVKALLGECGQRQRRLLFGRSLVGSQEVFRQPGMRQQAVRAKSLDVQYVLARRFPAGFARQRERAPFLILDEHSSSGPEP